MVERAHPRYAHEAAVTLHVEASAREAGNTAGEGEAERRATAGFTLQGRTANVSRGGLCAELVETIAVGADIEVDIQLVFDEDTHSEALRLPARVVWCTALDTGCQVGIAFKPLGRELGEYLTMFLRFLDDGTRPQRAKRESSLDKRFG